MWDSNPNCGIAREKKKRERELPCSLACSQNKGLSKYQRRASLLHTGPAPSHQRQRGRKTHYRQNQKARGNLSPRDWHPPPNCNRLPVARSSWDSEWLTSARRVKAWDLLPRGDTQHTWDSALTAHPGNWVVGTGEVIKTHGAPGTVCLPSTSSAELLEPGKGTKHMPNRVCAFVECPRTWTWAAQTWEVHEIQGQLLTVPLQNNLEPEQCRMGKHKPPWAGTNPVWPIHCKHSSHTPLIFVSSFPPSPQHNWKSEPK